MWRRRIILFLACAALVIAAGVFVRTWRAAHRVNVLLITLDTTRADRLGCYGYAKAETPALDRLAAQGVRFTRAFAQAPLTAPSHTCMLTGLCPPEHGVRDNGRSKLPENVPTLAESFRQRGYRTAAFLANFVLDRRFGLDRGFETYDDRMTVVGKFASAQENPANVVCDRALAWLGENTVRGFFCWVHFYDPHDPYAPPEPFKSRLQDPYDGEIAFMDSQIQRLLEFLDRRGLSDRTLVIVCGDHGQSFGEHEERGHGILVYKATMLVPLMVRMPGRILPGLDDRVARPVDIPATVAEVLKWRPGSHPFAAARRPNPRDAEGRRGTARSDERPWDGISLLAPGGGPQVSYGESLCAYYLYHCAPLYSLTTRRWKYIEAPQPELYDLAADPGECSNLAARASSSGTDAAAGARDGIAAEAPRVEADLRRQLDEMRAWMQPVRPVDVSLDQEARNKLRSLGYVWRAPLPLPDEVNTVGLADPKNVMGVVRKAQEHYNECQTRGCEFMQRGGSNDVVKAEALFRQAVDLMPEEDGAHNNLGNALFKLGRVDEAVAQYREALDLNPRNTEARHNLGMALKRSGALGEAEACFRQALAVNPDYAEASHSLGLLLLQAGRLDEALPWLERAVRLQPRHDIAWNNLGLACLNLAQQPVANAAAARRNLERAAACFRKSIEVNPDAGFAYNTHANLGACLLAQGDPDGAIAAFEKALGVKADCAPALNGLGEACAAKGAFGKAVAFAERALQALKPQEQALAQRIRGNLERFQAARQTAP